MQCSWQSAVVITTTSEPEDRRLELFLLFLIKLFLIGINSWHPKE
jgi:hypothetical protein